MTSVTGVVDFFWRHNLKVTMLESFRKRSLTARARLSSSTQIAQLDQKLVSLFWEFQQRMTVAASAPTEIFLKIPYMP